MNLVELSAYGGLEPGLIPVRMAQHPKKARIGIHPRLSTLPPFFPKPKVDDRLPRARLRIFPFHYRNRDRVVSVALSNGKITFLSPSPSCTFASAAVQRSAFGVWEESTRKQKSKKTCPRNRYILLAPRAMCHHFTQSRHFRPFVRSDRTFHKALPYCSPGVLLSSSD